MTKNENNLTTERGDSVAESNGMCPGEEGSADGTIMPNGGYNVTVDCDEPERELFWPALGQIVAARVWLVRTVARRAVKIVREQEAAR